MIVGIVIIICCINKRKSNLKEMERRVQLNTSNSAAPATTERRELNSAKNRDNELKEMKVERVEKEI